MGVVFCPRLRRTSRSENLSCMWFESAEFPRSRGINYEWRSMLNSKYSESAFRLYEETFEC